MEELLSVGKISRRNSSKSENELDIIKKINLKFVCVCTTSLPVAMMNRILFLHGTHSTRTATPHDLTYRTKDVKRHSDAGTNFLKTDESFSTPVGLGPQLAPQLHLKGAQDFTVKNFIVQLHLKITKQSATKSATSS